MDFFNLLRSAEELLFELAALVLLYPRTLWRCLRRPLWLARKVDEELAQEGKRRFDDMVSPPLCLLLSVALGSALSPGADPDVDATNALGDWIGETFYNQLIFGSLVVAMIPLMHAWFLLLAQRRAFDRETVRKPFYIQAYLVSPIAVAALPALSLAALEGTPAPGLSWFAYGLGVLSVIAYVVNSTRVAMSELRTGVSRALGLTLAAMFAGCCVSMLMLVALMNPAALAGQT